MLLLLYLLLCMLILSSSTFALLGMEREQQKPVTFKLVSVDNIEHTVSSVSLAASKTLNDLVQEPFFNSSKSIPVGLDDRVLGLLISCMEKISAIVPAEDQAAYNQEVANVLTPFFIDFSEMHCIGGIVFLPLKWFPKYLFTSKREQ